MKEFRDELLELLLKNSGEFISIKKLTDKYCGEDGLCSEEMLSKRLNVNLILRELVTMNWIDLAPRGGLSTTHTYNSNTRQQEFINDKPVRARLNTYGEIEYKKSQYLGIPQVQNVQNIGANYGIANQLPELKDSQININQSQGENHPKQNLTMSLWKWLFKHVIEIVIGLIAAFLIYKLGWN